MSVASRIIIKIWGSLVVISVFTFCSVHFANLACGFGDSAISIADPESDAPACFTSDGIPRFDDSHTASRIADSSSFAGFMA